MGVVFQVAVTSTCTLLACCCNCCCNQISQACGHLLPKQKLIKIYYILLNIFLIVPAIIIFYYVQQWVNISRYFGEYNICPQASGGGLNCLSSCIIYRLGFSLLLLYCVLFVSMFLRNRISLLINEGLFLLKYIMVIIIFIGMMYVKNEVFLNYAQVSKYLGVIFLIFQSIILIDLFYVWGIRWAQKYSDNHSQYGFFLIFLTIIVYSTAIFFNVIGYINFANNQWINIITSILIIIIPLIQLLNWNPQNSLLATSALCLYLSFLALIGQFSHPNRKQIVFDVMVADQIIFFVLLLITMYGSIMGTSKIMNNEDNNQQQLQQLNNEKRQQLSENIQDTNINIQLQNKNYSYSYSSKKWIKWHFYMIIMSIYIPMLITNWGSTKIDNPIYLAYKPNSFAFWSRISVQWITSILYLWTLVAPKILSNRNFMTT